MTTRKSREETEAAGRHVLALRAERESLLSQKASRKDAMDEIERVTSEMIQSDRVAVKSILSQLRTGKKLDGAEFRNRFIGTSSQYLLDLAKAESDDIEFGEIDYKEISKRVESIGKEETDLIPLLEYSSESPYWPEERRIRNKSGDMCDSWFPSKKPIPIVGWSLDNWLESLKTQKEEAPVASGKEI